MTIPIFQCWTFNKYTFMKRDLIYMHGIPNCMFISCTYILFIPVICENIIFFEIFASYAKYLILDFKAFGCISSYLLNEVCIKIFWHNFLPNLLIKIVLLSIYS